MSESPVLVFNSVAGIRSRTADNSDSATVSIIVGLSVLAVFFVGFGGWAAIAPLDSAITADGSVISSGGRKIVAQVDGGTVTGVAIKEGQFVRVGDLLLQLEDSRARAERDIAQQQLFLAQAHLARLQAELDGLAFIDFPPEVANSSAPYANAARKNEAVDFDNRRSILSDMTLRSSQQIDYLNEQIAAKQTRIEADQKQVVSMDAEQQGLSGLLGSGLVTKERSLDLERSSEQIKADIADSKLAISSYKQTILQVEIQEEQMRSSRVADVTTDLIATHSKTLQLQATAASAESALARLSVVAPYDGRVVNLRPISAGDVLLPGGAILDIVPENVPLVIQTRVAVDDVGQITRGEHAEAHFSALKGSDVSTIDGTVTQISADRLIDDHTGAAYFQAEVTPSDLSNAQRKLIYPGMSATVSIRTESRTALQYFVGPLLEAFSGGMRQR